MKAPSVVPRRARTRVRSVAAALVLLTAATPAAFAADDAPTARKIGDVGQFVPVAAGVALAATKHDGKGIRELAFATASALALTHSLKLAVNRQRPNGGHHSFPSGHTTLAFAGAGYVHLRYGWQYGLPAYAIGAFVGYSRVASKQHYTTDVLAGGAIGIGANVLFTRRFRGVAVTPGAGGGPGLTLSLTW